MCSKNDNCVTLTGRLDIGRCARQYEHGGIHFHDIKTIALIGRFESIICRTKECPHIEDNLIKSRQDSGSDF